MVSKQRTTPIPLWFINPRRGRKKSKRNADYHYTEYTARRRAIREAGGRLPSYQLGKRHSRPSAELKKILAERIAARKASKKNPRKKSKRNSFTSRHGLVRKKTAEGLRRAGSRAVRRFWRSRAASPREYSSSEALLRGFREARHTAQSKYLSNPRKRRKSARKRQRKQSMSRRKLYGAAAKSHRRRLAKAKRKRSRKNPGGISATKKGQAAGKPGAATRARKKAAAARARKKAAAARARKKGAAARARKKSAAARKRKKGARKKGARTRKRKGGGSKMARRKRSKVRLKARARRKRYGRGVRSLVRARRAIKYSRKHGSGFAKYYLKRYKMRSNPMGAIKDMFKQSVPVVAGILAARAASVGLSYIPGLDGILAKIPVVEPSVVRAVAGAGAVYALTRFVPPLKKFQGPAMVGAGVNLLLQAVAAYAPASVKGYIGSGEYVGVSGYQSDLADYEEMGNYEEVGAMEDVAGWADGLTRGVGSRSALKQLPSHSMIEEIPDFSEGSMSEGIFGNGWGVN